jgi:PilZ domain
MADDFLKYKRMYLRIPTPRGVWVSWQDTIRKDVSRVREVGFGGLFISTPNPLAVGTVLTLLLSVPEGEIRAGAIVRNTSPDEGMGVEFNEMGPEAFARLETLLTRLRLSMQSEGVKKV